MSKKQLAERYIRSIKNGTKRAYAGLWWEFINGRTYKPCERGLSYMAAQAVRSNLLAIYEKGQA